MVSLQKSLAPAIPAEEEILRGISILRICLRFQFFGPSGLNLPYPGLPFALSLRRELSRTLVEGHFARAKRETSAQSPLIIASFFFRLQPLICLSRAKASSREGISSANTNVTGSLLEV